MSYASAEAAVLEAMLPRLRAEGFQVFLHPDRTVLPPFMVPYRPDAIALRADRKIAIEVLSGQPRPDAEMRLAHLRRLLADFPDWELQVVYAPQSPPPPTIPAMPRGRIEEHLRRIPAALDSIGPAAALLAAWAGFEAAARLAAPAAVDRPTGSGALIEALAAEGWLTPDEAAALRRIAPLRSEAAHGRLDAAVTAEDVLRVVAVARALLGAADATA